MSGLRHFLTTCRTSLPRLHNLTTPLNSASLPIGNFAVMSSKVPKVITLSLLSVSFQLPTHSSVASCLGLYGLFAVCLLLAGCRLSLVSFQLPTHSSVASCLGLYGFLLCVCYWQGYLLSTHSFVAPLVSGYVATNLLCVCYWPDEF